MGGSKTIDERQPVNQTSPQESDAKATPMSEYQCYQAITNSLFGYLKVLTADALRNDSMALKIQILPKREMIYEEKRAKAKWSATVEMEEDDEEEDDYGYIKGAELYAEEITEYEISYARVQMRKIAQQLVNSLSRHRRRSKRQEYIDFRRTMRASIQTGGVMMDLKYKNRVIKKPRLIFVLDTSGSMQPWVKMLIQLVQAIGLELTKKEVFTFASDLERVTPDIKRTWEETAEALSEKDTWGGTTSLEASIERLCSDYKKFLSSQSIVLILSDLCTENPAKAAHEVRRLSHKVKGVYIFHTASEDEDYERYVVPFKGSATGLFDIYDLGDMAESVKKVVLR